MTRFMMSLDDAVDLVLFAFKNGKQGEIFIQKAPAATIDVLVKALTEILNLPNHPVNIIGTRHGEKLFVVLLSREEMVVAKDLGSYYCVPPDLRDLNYAKFVEQGDLKISEAVDFNSNNAARLDVSSLKNLLINLNYIQSILRGDQAEAEG